MTMSKKYSRVLLKISGEWLAGENDHGIDPSYVEKLASEIETIAHDTEVAIVVGGGNFIRGADFAGNGIELTTAHYMGALSTILNAMALTDMLENHGLVARLQTTIELKALAEPFIRRRGIRHLEKGRIVVVGGGTGRPYVTTDTAAVTTALELGCEIVLKATDVDGVFDKDPNKHDDATKYDQVSFQKVMENPAIKVMDKAAMGLAMEQDLPIIVFNLNHKGVLRQIIDGQELGTTVSG